MYVQKYYGPVLRSVQFLAQNEANRCKIMKSFNVRKRFMETALQSLANGCNMVKTSGF